MTLYHYPNCSTCKKAIRWLDAHGIKVTQIDIVAAPPSATTLGRIAKLANRPINKMFNTSGRSYREGGFRDRLASMQPQDMLAALEADGKLIKRPILVAKDYAVVGFDEAAFSQHMLGTDL